MVRKVREKDSESVPEGKEEGVAVAVEVGLKNGLVGVREGVTLTLKLALIEGVGLPVLVRVGEGDGDCFTPFTGDPDGGNSLFTAEEVEEGINLDNVEAMGDDEVELVVEREALPEGEILIRSPGLPWAEAEARPP